MRQKLTIVGLGGLILVSIAVIGTNLYRNSDWKHAADAEKVRAAVLLDGARVDAEREIERARERTDRAAAKARDLADRIEKYGEEQVSVFSLESVRLGDAVGLDLTLSVRWKADAPQTFVTQFQRPEDYSELVLMPKSREAANATANQFATVAEVFSTRRQELVDKVKAKVTERLAEPGVTIKEVMLSEVGFPEVLTRGLTQKALKEQELEVVRQEKFVALERSKAAEEQAKADGQVEIAKAEADGKAAEIAAKTEEKRRVTALAKAETESLVAERKTKTEADRQRKLAEVETDKVARLNNIEMDKVRAQKDVEAQRERELAGLCTSSPGYANFLISKELASKVQIAVLPMGPDNGTLGTLLQTMTPTGKLAENKRER